jgi:hypothetical protein
LLVWVAAPIGAVKRRIPDLRISNVSFMTMSNFSCCESRTLHLSGLQEMLINGTFNNKGFVLLRGRLSLCGGMFHLPDGMLAAVLYHAYMVIYLLYSFNHGIHGGHRFYT